MCTEEQGHQEGGVMNPGPMDFGGATRGPHGLQEGSKKAHQLTFKKEYVRPYFWRSPDFDRKKR